MNLRKSERLLLIEALGGKCYLCSSTENLEIDHAVPLNKGGADSVKNLHLLCEDCHIEKTKRDTVKPNLVIPPITETEQIFQLKELLKLPSILAEPNITQKQRETIIKAILELRELTYLFRIWVVELDMCGWKNLALAYEAIGNMNGINECESKRNHLMGMKQELLRAKP